MLETQTPQTQLPSNGGGAFLDVDAELKKFEQEQMEALGIAEARPHWVDNNPQQFTKDQRAHTTILVGGLTMAHDMFIAAALRGIGYKVKAIDVPDNAALSVGKEFGNRGQCNPTYFTVGNLVKILQEMRDQGGMPKNDIVDNYLFVTAGACGPCRFGTYVTEYRKALRDAGFDGFRVLLFQQQGGLKQATGSDAGLEMNPKFFGALVMAVLAGDVLNVLGYRIRPFEVEKGATDRALAEAKQKIADSLEQHPNNPLALAWALLQARRVLSRVAVDRSRVKPKVSVIGEFWAMTTEGDGNYGLQRFLEAEGAEVDIQTVTAWLLFMLWEQRWDTKQRMVLRGADKARKGLDGKDPQKKLLMLWVGEQVVRGLFHTMGGLIGLHGYHLTDMDLIADAARNYYNNHLRGGEGHMEVGKFILNVQKKKATMTLSVKPFGCMPSSGVSDGVQSYISEKYPGSIFCAIETNGDGAVNVYSRVQMMLFKARKAAEKEFDEALKENGLTLEEFKRRTSEGKWAWPFTYPRHTVASTAANTVFEVTPKSLRQRAAHLVENARHAAEWLKTGGVAQAKELVELARATLQ
ncbi:MAG TPA: 2-hydroxyglutaryl-CoA dehydratase [Polyangia bacterium]|jgi:predicted nucleotide-binding protein (sugar kinase/HSP70/actin superfamily)|nr:2-hydroxyglutaryl-CoA dehydratase [Polyangia bacterium]